MSDAVYIKKMALKHKNNLLKKKHFWQFKDHQLTNNPFRCEIYPETALPAEVYQPMSDPQSATDFCRSQLLSTPG